MSTDPHVSPPPSFREAALPGKTVARKSHIPNFGHLALFLAVTGLSLLITQLLAVGIASGLHLFPHKALVDMARDPRLILPTMFLSYLVAGLLSIIVFTAMWHLPFTEGIRWDLEPVRRHRWKLILAGVALSMTVQLLSNFLPIPKDLPMDQFFKTPLDVWLVAFFGIFIAPVCEELAFRGFLLPALANTWDYLGSRFTSPNRTRLEATHFEQGGDTLPGTEPMVQASTTPQSLSSDQLIRVEDPHWSPPALLFATTATSICFSLLHADQLAHAWAPLGVLFVVSVVLCVVRLRWHSLAASALVHACYNGTIFALLFVATSGFRHLDKLKQ